MNNNISYNVMQFHEPVAEPQVLFLLFLAESKATFLKWIYLSDFNYIAS